MHVTEASLIQPLPVSPENPTLPFTPKPDVEVQPIHVPKIKSAPDAVVPDHQVVVARLTPAELKVWSIVPLESIRFQLDFICPDGPFTTVVAPSNPIAIGKSKTASPVPYESKALTDKQGTGDGVAIHVAVEADLEFIAGDPEL